MRTRAPLWLVLLVAAGVACGDSDKKRRRDGGVDGEVPTEDATVSEEAGGPGPDAALDGTVPDGTVGMVDGDGSTVDGETPDGGGVGADADVDADVDGAVTDGGVDGDAAANTSITTARISFGLAGCGGSAPANQTFSLPNTGGQALTWSASLSSTSAFELEGATNGVVTGSVAGGQTGTLTIKAKAVPASAAAGVDITANLTVITNAPAPYDNVTIPVSITPQGATLEAIDNVVFDSVQYNQVSSARVVTLRNTGNAAASVTVTQPTATQFRIRTTADAVPGTVTVPASSNGTPGTLDLNAFFAPTTTGTLSGSAGLSVAAPVCTGGSATPTQISLQGTGSGTGFVASLTRAMNNVDCGAAADALPTATIDVSNYTSAGITATPSLEGGDSSPFEIVGAGPITLGAPETKQVTVRLKTGQSLVTTAPRTVFTDTLVLTPSDSALPTARVTNISTEVQGAVLAFEPVDEFDFTSATAVSPQTETFRIVNKGNRPATPTLGIVGTNAAQFTLVDGASTTPAAVPVGTVASPGEATFRVSFRPPAGDPNEKTATVAFSTASTDVICQPSAGSFALTGETETPGFRLDTPASLTFDVDCPTGATITGATTQIAAASFVDVTFSNTGSQPLDWSADLVGSYFDIDDDEGTVAAGATATIRVTPRALPFPASTATNTYGGTLTITPDVLGQDPQVITLTQTARGAVITATRSATDFGFVHTGLNAPLNPAFTVRNQGNLAATLTVTPNIVKPGASNPQYTFNSTTNAAFSLGVPVGESVPVNGVFAPGTANSDAVESTVDAVFSANALALCDRLPDLTPFIGTGTTAIVYYSDDEIDFPTTTCGTTASPVTVIVYNTGNEEFIIESLDLTAGAGSPFTAYFGAPGITRVTVPRAINNTPGTAALTIAPKYVSPLAADGVPLTDVLTVPYTIGGVAQTPQTIDIELPVNCP